MHKDNARVARAVREVSFHKPTQEERLHIVEYNLEHFKTETIKAYGDMAMELVMIKGLTEDGVKRLIALKRTADEHTMLLNRQNERLDRVEATLGDHTARFEHLETMLTQILARLPEKP